MVVTMAVGTADTGGATVAGACTDAAVVDGAFVLVVIVARAFALDGQDNHHHDLKKCKITLTLFTQERALSIRLSSSLVK